MVATKIIRVEHDREKMAKAIDFAVKVVQAGGVIVFPTETSYGIGADATNDKAIRKVEAIKARDPDRPMPVVVSDLRMAREYAVIDEKAERLIEAFMPGPLALVLEKKKLPDSLSESGIAFRIPGKEFTRILVQECGVPLVATSANLAGQPDNYKFEDVKSVFGGKVDLILDAGDLPSVLPSTIIDLRHNPPAVLREGPLSSKEIFKELERFEKK